MFFHHLRSLGMFSYQCKVLSWLGRASVFVFALASLATSSRALQADVLSPGYAMQTLNNVTPDGQFTAYDGQIHYWSSSVGYQIYNTTSGSTTTIGLPPNGTITNGGGDAFGVFDPVNNVFYAATVAPDYSSYVYEYNNTAGTWSNSTSAGVHLASAYGGQVYNGQLYVSGLPAAWTGSPQSTEILAFGQTAIPNGPAPQVLIQASGYSADLAIAPNGDVYYGTNDTDMLYRWTAAQVANAANTNTPLTTGSASQSWSLPGDGSGLAVNSAGNVFFAVNNFNSAESTLAILDPTAPSGYDDIYTSDTGFDYFGAISVDGDFLHGGTLYFNPGIDYGSTLVAIQAVPEPGSLALLAAAAVLALAGWRRRRS